MAADVAADVAALERALASWVRGSAVSAELGRVALDGKRPGPGCRVRGQPGRRLCHHPPGPGTSLAQEKAGAAFLLELSRPHWGIENRLHLVRDVSFAEDAWRVRSGAAPQTLAAFRNTVLTLMRRRSGNITGEIEHFQENRQQALNLVGSRRIE